MNRLSHNSLPSSAYTQRYSDKDEKRLSQSWKPLYSRSKFFKSFKHKNILNTVLRVILLITIVSVLAPKLSSVITGDADDNKNTTITQQDHVLDPVVDQNKESSPAPVNGDQVSIDSIITEQMKDLLNVNGTSNEQLSQIIIPDMYYIAEYDYPGYMKYRDDINSNLFDPRLIAFLWIGTLKHHIIENKGQLSEDFRIPFHWNDWIDLPRRLKPGPVSHLIYMQNHQEEFGGITKEEFEKFNFLELTCEKLNKYYQMRPLDALKQEVFPPAFPRKICSNIEDERELSLLRSYGYIHNFKISAPSDMHTPHETAMMAGASYLFLNAPMPSKLVFLGAGLDQDSSVTLIPMMKKSDKQYSNVLRMINDYLYHEGKLSGQTKNQIYDKGFTLHKELTELHMNYAKQQNQAKVVTDLNKEVLLNNVNYLMKPKASDKKPLGPTRLTNDEFQWSDKKYTTYMLELKERALRAKSKAKAQDSKTLIDQVFYDTLETSQSRYEDRKFTKYFHEPMLADFRGAHYDWRFFNGIIYEDYTKQAVLHRMGRAFLRFCYMHDIKSWIGYGSLLGWYRNGMSLKWDEDIDMILPMESFLKLTRNFNQSLIIDVSPQDEFNSGIGAYFIDITDSSVMSRDKEDGNNLIDGRFIDTLTGSFIDLTVLANTDVRGVGTLTTDMRILIDPEYNDKIQELTDPSDRSAYLKHLNLKYEKLYDEKKLYHDRNYNFFKLAELDPLVSTLFEGVRTFVPHAYLNLINRKYPKALSKLTENSFEFKKNLRLWIEDYRCPSSDVDNNGEYCTSDENLVFEYAKTSHYTILHKIMMEELEKKGDLGLLSREHESLPFRYDDFVYKYSKLIKEKS